MNQILYRYIMSYKIDMACIVHDPGVKKLNVFRLCETKNVMRDTCVAGDDKFKKTNQ